MIEFKDIHKALADRSVSFTSEEIDSVCSPAAVELAKRSILGAVLIPLCFLMAMFASGFVSKEPQLCLQLSMLMVTGLLIRAISISKILSSGGKMEARWLQLLFCGCVFMALVWGVLTSAFIYHFLSGFPLILILVLSAGIGSGAIVNMCIWSQLGITYLMCIFLPVIVVGLKLGPADLVPAIIGVIFFLAYLLVQLRFWNTQYWNTMLSTYISEIEAENQKRVNEKLRSSLDAMAETRQELHKERDQFRRLLDNLKAGVVVCGLTGETLEVNRTFARLINSEPEEICYLSFFELLTPRDKEDCGLAARWESAVHGKVVDFDCWLAKAGDKSYFHGRINLKKVSWGLERVILVTVEDISAQKEDVQSYDNATESLSRSEGYLRAILQNIKFPIYCKDLEGTYLSVNRNFERLTGLSADLIVGNKDADIFSENEGVSRFFRFRDEEVSKTGEPVELEGTYPIGGKERNILIHKFPLRKGDGSIYATAGICTDISIMKNALQAAQLANEAKSEFLANITHELRTPMHSILSFARLGEKRAKLAPREKLESYYGMIIKSGDLLLELLSGLLDLSSLESNQSPYSFGKHNLVTDIKKNVAEFSAMMDESNIALCLEVEAEVAWARYDRTKVFQVMRNLISNALKFSSPGKEICVRLKNEQHLLQGTMQPVWQVMIIDQGIGIAKEELGTVFGKFVQGIKAGRGTGGVGLGLAICKRIIEDHGGVIWAEQNEPEGAVFSFVLPVID